MMHEETEEDRGKRRGKKMRRRRLEHEQGHLARGDCLLLIDGTGDVRSWEMDRRRANKTNQP